MCMQVVQLQESVHSTREFSVVRLRGLRGQLRGLHGQLA